MVHGDDSGLVLPPRIAPTQAVVVPIAMHKEGVLEEASKLRDAIAAAGIRVKLDDTDKSPGWKFSEQEILGIPARIEIGPKDIEAVQCVIVRRDNREKTVVAIDDAAAELQRILDQEHNDMYERAKKHLYDNLFTVTDYETFKDTIANKPGFVKAMWCGDLACEMKIKEDTTATSRCMPFEQEKLSDVCVCCGKPAKTMVLG